MPWSSGALVPEKSCWYSINFKWKSGKWNYMPKKMETKPLMMTDHQGQQQPLLQLHTSKTRWMLGVYLAPDGNNWLQQKVLLKKTWTWAANTWAAHLDRTAAWLNITMTLIWQVCYVLPATTLSANQCEWIMTPCLTAGMVAAGYNWSFPWAIIHAPNKYYGLNLMDMHTEQGIQHILVILQYGHSLDDLTRQLIRESLETMIVELGGLGNPFTNDYNKMHQLTMNTWMKMVWKFQHQHNIWIEMDLPKLETSRVNDRFLIPSFIQSGLTGSALSRINRCWIYLHVMTLVDICDSTGVYILPAMWAGQPNQPFTTGYNWPNQGWPPKKIGSNGNWHYSKPFWSIISYDWPNH